MIKTEDWEARYQNKSTGWDIGYAAPAIVEYMKQLDNKELNILIPGCGNAHEASALYEMGFKHIYLADIAPSPLKNFKEKNPSFPQEQLILGDFFELEQEFDLIIEQTFFCAIDPQLRQAYAHKCKELLKPNGKIIGLLWSVELNQDHPPYGGNKEEYLNYFKADFDVRIMEPAHNSIPPRAGRELFILLQKKA